MRQHTLLLTALLATAALSTSCTSMRRITYFQGLEQTSLADLPELYEARIKPDDELTIIISGPDKQVVQPFNLTLNESFTTSPTDPERSALGYLVDSKGDIDLPILGKIYVEGMTRMELRDTLVERLKEYIKEPIAYVAFRNYRITVLGDVKSPGTYTMPTERVTILQALGAAGDLTITARRENILLLREVEGRNQYTIIDITDPQLLSSPHFFLQQNDVIYVSPSRAKAAQGTMATGVWSIALSSITTLIAILSLTLK